MPKSTDVSDGGAGDIHVRDEQAGPPGGAPRLTRRELLLATSALVLLPRRARAQSAIVGSEDHYPPFTFNRRGRRCGYDVEKVELVLDEIRYRAVHHSLLRRAMLEGLDEGTVDMAFPLVGTPERMQKYIMVGPLHMGTTTVALRTSDTTDPASIAALAGRRVGVVEGWIYTPEFDAATNIEKVSCSSLTLAVRRLAAGRVDATIGDRVALAHLIKTEGLSHALRLSAVTYGHGPRYVAFPRSRAALAAQFKDALARLDAAGRFADLDARYLGPVMGTGGK